MTGLGVVVMATLERSEAALQLSQRVGGEVAYDPGGSQPSALRGHCAALRHALDTYLGMSHICVLQEDAITCPHFTRVALDVAAAQPTSLVSLYLGSNHAARSVYLRRLRSCQRFAKLPLNHFVPTVGIIWPVPYANAFLGWVHGQPDSPYDDEAIRLWRQAAHKHGDTTPDAVASIPSIVNHDNRLPSVIGHRSHGARSALCSWRSWNGYHDWRDGWQ